jgi:hypothetical protein
VHRGQSRTKGQHVDAQTITRCEGLRNCVECLDACPNALHRSSDILASPNFQRDYINSKRAPRRLDLADLNYPDGTSNIHQHSEFAQTGQDFAHKLDPLRRDICRLV